MVTEGYRRWAEGIVFVAKGFRDAGWVWGKTVDEVIGAVFGIWG